MYALKCESGTTPKTGENTAVIIDNGLLRKDIKYMLLNILEVLIFLILKMNMNNSFRHWWLCPLILLALTFLHVSLFLSKNFKDHMHQLIEI